MWRTLSNGLNRIYVLAGYGAGLLLILLCCMILYSVLARQLGLYLGGVNDFAGYVMATSTFMALAYTFHSNGHIRVALVIQRFSGNSRRNIELFCLAFMSFITGYLAFYIARLTYFSYIFEERSEGADAVLIYIPQIPAMLGSFLFFVAVLHTFFLAVFDYDSVNPETSQHEGPSEI